ncbi:hypothetical protein FACS1894182_12930 [Bacteroidia bacterium]|nr:hypothetical protein FACS1894182_12930 [Bacteroidia bacterium]
MKRFVFLTLFVISFAHSFAQDYRTQIIDKKVKDFAMNNDFSTPIDAFVSIQHLIATGRNSELDKKNTFRVRLRNPKGSVDKETTQEFQTQLLNEEIKALTVYCDSVAAVITKEPNGDYYTRFLNLEQGIWVNGGQDRGGETLEATDNKVRAILPIRLTMLRKTNKVLNTPTDTTAFVHYLNENGAPPKQFLLEALAEHKLVIFGERHRRELSWQLLKDLVNDPNFRKVTGTVFMELQSYKQSEIDKFFHNTAHMDSSILIAIYQDLQLPGWFDKGGFEFLITLWELNKKLPDREKIKVVFTDFQPQFYKIKTKEELRDYKNNVIKRNTHMANIIEHTMKTSFDERNNLFIVGYGHAYKSPSIDEYGESPEGDCSAASQLVKRFADKDIFCTRVHTSGINGYTRGGMFDSAFVKNGGCPVAFKLKGSPFGKEIIEQWAFEKDNFGSFENNYDGYIYLGGEPIDKHPEYLLTDIYTEDFVKEIIRRVYLFGLEGEMWFGVPINMLTLEAVLKDLNE